MEKERDLKELIWVFSTLTSCRFSALLIGVLWVEGVEVGDRRKPYNFSIEIAKCI
jgi:hypothetical protein